MLHVNTLWSTRRWGRGRLGQLIRLRCRLTGHDFSLWHWDWPYDVAKHWEDAGEPVRDPRPDEPLVWYRHCTRDCGCIEYTEATLLQRAALPGESLNLKEGREWFSSVR